MSCKVHIRWETGDIYTKHIFNDHCWAIIESPTSCFWLFIASTGCLLTGERVRGHWRRMRQLSDIKTDSNDYRLYTEKRSESLET